MNLSNRKDISVPQIYQPKKLTNFKWKICKGDVNIGTLIVPQIFKKASVKNGHMA